MQAMDKMRNGSGGDRDREPQQQYRQISYDVSGAGDGDMDKGKFEEIITQNPRSTLIVILILIGVIVILGLVVYKLIDSYTIIAKLVDRRDREMKAEEFQMLKGQQQQQQVVKTSAANVRPTVRQMQ